MSDNCAMAETVVKGITEASVIMLIKSTNAANLITELTAENERLRACLGNNCADCAVGMGEYADSLCDPLKVENAKLRELVTALWDCCAWETDSIGWCEDCEHHDTEEGGCKLEKSLRELGIEVEP